MLTEIAIFLAAAVVAVPISKRLGLGAVLGYLIAGIAIGPSGLGLIPDVEDVLHFAEFGVVLLLFIIGLELQPSRLYVLRKTVFGLGGAQVAITAVLIGAAALALGTTPAAAVVAALGLSLSSTAFALQILAEKKQLTTRYGRSAFGILLFQDLAIIPMLALVPLLGSGAGGSPSEMLLGTAKAVAVIAAVIVGGHYLLRPVLRIVAGTGIHEIFTAAGLLVVVGTALAMYSAGLSMALGAFLAGVLLADSEYRHELEADIEPFKGLLLGLFFIAVGMSVDLGLVARSPLVVAGLALALVAVKGAVLYALGRRQGLDVPSAISLAVVIPQGGEFAFVLFGVAVTAGAMASELADLLIVVVTVSMILTPLLVLANERLVAPRLRATDTRDFDTAMDQDNPVIVAGFGRFGQIVARVLTVRHIPFTALDASPEHVDFVRQYGNRIFYGDAARLEMLRAAGADRAKVFVLAIADIEASLKTAELVMKHFPHLKLYARARDRIHAYRLMDAGVRHLIRDTFLSSLDLAEQVLLGLGTPISEASVAVAKFKDYDQRLLAEQQKIHHDEEALRTAAIKSRQELERLFELDAMDE